MRTSSRLRLLLIGTLAASLSSAAANGICAGPEPIRLWAGKAPGAVGDKAEDQPELRIYLPPMDKATGAGVVICPGGGYGVLATDHEGHQVAKWFNRIGVAGFVLKYRLGPRYRHPAPLQDLQRALRYVRAKSAEMGVASNRIGVMGFSAGGHLASTAATHFDAGDAESDDPIERESSRPDFVILGYPVITMQDEFTHGGSRRNLLGDDPDADLVELLSNEKQVTEETPPAFLFHTGEDPAVRVENSVEFYLACKRAGVPAELHVYQHGPHGIGLGAGDPITSTWKGRLADWMRGSAFLANLERASAQGKARVNGEPLRWGMISFVPEKPENKPTAFALVHNGSFKIPIDRGPVVGLCRIELYDLGSVEPQPTIEDAEKIDVGAVLVTIKSGENRIIVDADR